VSDPRLVATLTSAGRLYLFAATPLVCHVMARRGDDLLGDGDDDDGSELDAQLLGPRRGAGRDLSSMRLSVGRGSTLADHTETEMWEGDDFAENDDVLAQFERVPLLPENRAISSVF
jgi:hypothetical protein